MHLNSIAVVGVAQGGSIVVVGVIYKLTAVPITIVVESIPQPTFIYIYIYNFFPSIVGVISPSYI